MVVTRSRLHAVRYKIAFDEYIKEKKYTDLKTLVAFSGTVEEEDGTNYTESNMNGFGERELPERFNTREYQVLIVAEKYQTGFDQPLLHTMFVDKPLRDLKAVQTLSRLNRTTGGKVDTFILDFANEVDDIKEAFKPYFEQTQIDEPLDPNLIYTLDATLRVAPVLRQEDINAFAAVYFKPQDKQTKQDHGQLNKWIDPAVARYKEEYRDLSVPFDEEAYTEEGEEFKSTLQSFVRLYGFLSQVIDWQDIELEKLYAYGRYLLTKLPYRSNSGLMRLDGEIELFSYRNEKTFEGSAALTLGEPEPVKGRYLVGTGGISPDKCSLLSTIVNNINDRFGTDWTNEDQLLFEQISGDMFMDDDLTQKARVNTKEQFSGVFKD
jgi:type I restriction enzyme R subunit